MKMGTKKLCALPVRLYASAAAASLLAAGPAAAERFEANQLVFTDILGTVEIVTNGGDEIDVVVEQGKTYSRVSVGLDEEGRLIIAGEPRDEYADDCCNRLITRQANLRKDRTPNNDKKPSDAFFAEHPTIKVTMPRERDVSFVDARMKIAMGDIVGALDLDSCYAYGEIGDVEEAAIDLTPGSRLVVGDIGAALELNVSGDADVLTGDAAMVDVDMAGAGDVVLGSVDGVLDVSIAGSGNVRATRLEGPLTARIAGSGAVAVQGGRAEQMKVTIDGSGGVFFDGAVIGPELRLRGSSEVRMGSMTGSMKHAGGGEVYVGDKRIEPKE